MRIPQSFEVGCNPAEIVEILKWWQGLPYSEQIELSRDCSPQAESCLFGRDNESGSWIALPLVVESRLVEVEDTGDDWIGESWECPLNHPEDFPIPLMDPRRVFHIGVAIVAIIERWPWPTGNGQRTNFNGQISYENNPLST